MVKLLGKRPFTARDDMDKWLDENRGEKSAPPPLEPSSPPELDNQAPIPAPISKALDDRTII